MSSLLGSMRDWSSFALCARSEMTPCSWVNIRHLLVSVIRGDVHSHQILPPHLGGDSVLGLLRAILKAEVWFPVCLLTLCCVSILRRLLCNGGDGCLGRGWGELLWGDGRWRFRLLYHLFHEGIKLAIGLDAFLPRDSRQLWWYQIPRGRGCSLLPFCSWGEIQDVILRWWRILELLRLGRWKRLRFSWRWWLLRLL